MNAERSSRRCSVMLAIALLAVPATASAAAPAPAPIDLGVQGPAEGINDNGQVVAGAWLLKQGAGRTPLPFPATAINDAAKVVGGNGSASAWTPTGGATALATPPQDAYRWAWAYDVNAPGQVVGMTRDRFETAPTDRAVLWSPEGSMIDLGTLPNAGSAMATAINDSGQVVGTSGEMGSYSYGGHAFLWTQAGGMVDLGVLPGGDYSHANAINDAGQVVGDSGTFFSHATPVHAFIWTQAGGMVDLGTLPGAADSYAYGINDHGQVVGKSGGRPFLWSASTGMTELGLLPGGKSGVAFAINDAGQVAGESDAAAAPTNAVLWFGDTTAPVARVKALRGEKLAGVRSRGLRVTLTMSEPGSVKLTLRLARTRATLATKSVTVKAAGRQTITFKLARKVRRGLRKVTRSTFAVRASAQDLAGNSSSATAKLIIRH